MPRKPTSISLVILFATAITGCAQTGAPIVAGPDYLGFGWFVQRKPQTFAIEANSKNTPLTIDVEGVGLLYAAKHLSLGYTKINYISIPPNQNTHIKLNTLEIATGTRAETTGLNIILEDTPPIPGATNQGKSLK